MINESIKLKFFRLTIFPLIMIIELVLSVLFLVMPYFDTNTYSRAMGYQLFFGWLLSVLSLFAFISILLLFLSSFNYKESRFSAFFTDERKVQIIGYATVFLLYLQIVSLGVTQIYQAPFMRDLTPLYSLILGISLLLSILLYFLANFESVPTRVYAFSEESLVRFKLTAFWLIFLTGAMQLFATEWSILVIGLLFLVTSFFFFFLYRYSVILTPIVLIVHFAFSSLMAGISLSDIITLLENLNTGGIEVSHPQAITLSVFFLIVPAIISIVLAQSFFRKWVLAWVKEINPEPEMEVQLEYADE